MGGAAALLIRPPTQREMADGTPGATVSVPIHRPGAAPEAVSALVEAVRAALGRQPSVARVRHDVDRGALVIHYDDRRGAGRVLAGIVHDRLRAARGQPPVVDARLEVSVQHRLPGRVRLKITGARDGVEKVAALLAQVPGVERTRPSPATGSILVLFDPRLTSTEALLVAIADTPSTSWPAPVPAPSSAAAHEKWKTAFSAAVLGGVDHGPAPRVSVMLGGVAITAIPPFRRALRSLGEGRSTST